MQCANCAARGIRTSDTHHVPDPRAVCNFGAQGRSSAAPAVDRLTSRGAQLSAVAGKLAPACWHAVEVRPLPATEDASVRRGHV
jgi:hypothetical protein